MSGLLLDTHALIWWMIDPTRLSVQAHEAICNPNWPTMVSVVSAYEIELKRARDPTLDRLPKALVGIVPLLGFSWLPALEWDQYVLW